MIFAIFSLLHHTLDYAGGDSSGEENEEDGDDDDDLVADGRHSIKRSFLAKLLSPLLGYSSNFELVQFVYDLNLWSALGAKRNVGSGAPLRVMMGGHTFSPIYWKRVHNALVDLVRQVGLPTLFWTISPYEWSFPYHELIKDRMQKELRARLHLPVEETLHIAHCLTQVVCGLLTGTNQQTKNRQNRRWQKHVLSAKDGSGRQTVVNFFTRLEFQDGSRKPGTQTYHGSGRVHLHCLLWLKDLGAVNLPGCMSATMPPEDSDLAGYVRGSQQDHDRESKWPVFEQPSFYDKDNETLHLHHAEEDHDLGLRAYFPDVMDALRCHQDLQLSDGEALLLQYVSKYVSKFSDSSYDEWLNDQAGADSVARRVLFEYHPLEPEMILQLAGANFRQWGVGTASGGKRSLVAPSLTDDEPTKEMQLYMESAWRREDMSFLEFLRKTNARGEIAGWLKKKWKEIQATLDGRLSLSWACCTVQFLCVSS